MSQRHRRVVLAGRTLAYIEAIMSWHGLSSLAGAVSFVVDEHRRRLPPGSGFWELAAAMEDAVCKAKVDG